MLEEFLPTNDWSDFFRYQFSMYHINNLNNFVSHEKNNGSKVIPNDNEIFTPFQNTPLSDVKVVIIGKEPHPDYGSVGGFYVGQPQNQQPSRDLTIVLNELESDLGGKGDLETLFTGWSDQGVLMFNELMTTVQGSKLAHKNIGWEQLTKSIIEKINTSCSNVVFLSWGGYAHEICMDVDESKHAVIRTSSSSNHSGAYKKCGTTRNGLEYVPFIGSGCFSKANKLLIESGRSPIDWL